MEFDPASVDKYLVIPDLHGQSDKLYAVINHYRAEAPQLLSLGDVLDGGINPRDCVQMLIDEGAVILSANHEWTALAAMQSTNNQSVWQRIWLGRYQRKTLESYAVRSSEYVAMELREKMRELGHLAFLNSALPYFETPEFIAVHAGLTDEPWEDQKAYLDAANADCLAGDYDSEAEQIFDLDFVLSTQDTTTATDKLVVSGHAHNRTTSINNYPENNRLRLASKMSAGLPLFVWESWTGKIVPF